MKQQNSESTREKIPALYPPKLQAGDEMRIIAPSRSLGIIGQDTQHIANKRLADVGLKITFGKHVQETDAFNSSSIESRLEDMHDAFRDKNVKAVLTVIGGFNSNQLLKYLDWDLIQNNPKIFCGYSDITALNNAMFTKTGLVSYSGPHYSTFGQELYFDYTLNYFKQCLFSDDPITIEPSGQWSDDEWYKNQQNRSLIPNQGFLAINNGVASGTLLGANIGTLNLLQGTEYFPNLKNSILFLEDDSESLAHTFDRDLQSLIHLPGFSGVKGIIIGRFQKASHTTNELLAKIIKTKKELAALPVIAGVDFGHTDPKITFPVGGEVILTAQEGTIALVLTKH
ncbi:LD-carboxypeptidase [bacterium CG10_46_32]|nr:MAG: LD-carboxypeptidase [bacterium CG10_46_32]PIR56548.1 MAG: LD-carboxypeptidase [Parcubacteria group bacterium CG10_big_fil_rev_8_21_14_0_10_46_32]